MSMSKLPTYLLGMLGLFMHQTGVAEKHAVPPVVQSKPRSAAMPCLIGNTGLAEKLIDFRHTKGPLVPYQPLGFPIAAGATFQINTKPKALSEAQNKIAIADNVVGQINQVEHLVRQWVSGNVLFDGVALFNPWMMGYFAFMGPQVAVHNAALILGNASFPFSSTIGRFHIPFGLNATEDLDGGLTGKLGTAENTTAVTVNFEPTLFNHHTVRLKGFVFSPKTSAKEDAVPNAYSIGGNFHYEAAQGDINWALGLSYATRLAKSEADIEGINAYVNVGAGPFRMKVEGVTGYETGLLDKKNKTTSTPYAWTFEGSIHGVVMNRDSAIVGGYSQGENGEFLKETGRIYCAFKHALSKRLKATLAWQQDSLLNASVAKGKTSEKGEGASSKTQEPKQSINLQFAYTIA